MTYRTTFVNRWPAWPERLAAGYVVDSNGCHVWQKSKNNRGYGVIWFDGKLHLAHRAAWLLRHGSWPNRGLVIDHACNNKSCVNADHLRELTNGENIQRAIPRGDADTEKRREIWRAANQKRRNASGGGRHQLVQG